MPCAADSTSALAAAQTTSRPCGAKPACPDTSIETTRPAERRAVTVSPSENRLREGDLVDPEFGDRLPVAMAAADSLLRLVAEGDDLRALGLTDDRRTHRCLVDGRAADDEILAIVREQDAVEDDFRIDVAGDAVEPDDLAFSHLELAAVEFDDGVHWRAYLSYRYFEGALS